MEERRPHREGAGDGLLQKLNGATVREKLTPAPERYGRQGQGQFQNPSDCHGSTSLQLADRELQRIPVLRLLPSRREFRGYDFQAPPPHFQPSFHHQPHPRPRPPTYQSIRRDTYTMVGKVSERVLAREGEYFWNAMRCDHNGDPGRHAPLLTAVPSLQASRGPTMA